ncbi:MAG: Na(+)-translocating NADH-quinone reductase subunit A [Alistipes sp.]|nr:Na(+)-translocating NADH-quinone reductase subunit A [Alistipes sp.]MBO7243303.1 Na(+)-translocating NADH-quinone reductase subunit A [Alistipes sp.]
MSKNIKLRKGLDINLAGKAEARLEVAPMAKSYAVSPLDFENVTPKLLVKVGDKVEAGSALFFDKNNPRILFTSPVSGEVTAINRGEKRKLLNVAVTPDQEQVAKAIKVVDPAKAERSEIVEMLLESGLWTRIVERPFGVIANPDATPKAIFVSAFDSAPLTPDYNFILKEEKAAIEAGMALLGRLTEGKVHLSARKGDEGFMAEVKGVEYHTFEGKHPAGNVGVQIHHIDRIAKGDIVWTVNIQDVAIIGRFVLTGKFDMSKTIVVAGSEAQTRCYKRIIAGAAVESIVGKVGENVRVISGNVLTGRTTAADGYISADANMLTLIPEGNVYELLGWAMPRFHRFSVSRAYFSWLCPKKEYKLDTNLNGGERPFVVTGLYENYLPMDVYVSYLLKACLVKDLDKMENLGLYEVLPEDLALCEFVDPSKIEMQQILRDGINLMIKES